MKKLQNKDESGIIIGVTGGFGSGKSLVARIFASCGFKLIDADKIAHQVICPGSKAYRRIIKIFGKGILKKDKQINRSGLSRIVFNDKRLLKRLNDAVHPEVIKAIRRRIRFLSGDNIVLDAPLLMEAGLNRAVDILVVVKAGARKQIARIQKRFDLSKTDILKRIKTQIPLRQKARWADFIIDNNGTIANTRRQVRSILRQVR
jgi:dephospho-CoA kinase